MYTLEGKTIVLLFLLHSISENYTRLHNKELITNPVERIALMAHGSEDEVFLDKIIKYKKELYILQFQIV